MSIQMYPQTRLAGLSLFLALLSIGPSGANPISFAPNGDNNAGKLKCDVPVSSLGKLPLRNGIASISGRVISIKAGSEFSETPRTVLVGSVLRSEANLGDTPTVSGLALFLMGDYEGQIDDGSTPDLIFCKEKHMEGRILGIEDETISVKLTTGQEQKIPLNAILYIRSPRVFVFKIGLKSKQALQKDTVFQAESGDVSFRPTAQARTLSGSIIPASEKKEDDGFGMSSGGGMMNPAAGFSRVNNFNSTSLDSNSVIPPGMKSAVPDQRNDSFDNGESADRFATVKTKYGKTKITVPPGFYAD